MTKNENVDDIYKCVVDYSIVNANIRKYRQQAHLTQSELAEKSHIAPKYLSKLENNYYKSRLHVYFQIAEALNISIYDLISNSERDKDFVSQLNLLTRDITDNQKKLILDGIKLIKTYKF